MPGTVDLGGATRTFTITDGTPAIDVSITAGITGAGGLTKAGAGTLLLSGNNTFTGSTAVQGGLLALSGLHATLGPGDVLVQASPSGTELQIQSGVSDAIANTATLSITNGAAGAGGLAALVAGGATVDLGAGINEIVQSLLLNGAAQAPGTYGSSTSGALFKNDAFFSGTGVITVLVPEPANSSLLLVAVTSFVVRRRRR